MRAGTSTDDYLIVDGEIWRIIDTSPHATPLCGICMGYTMYGTREEDCVSYKSCLEITDGVLTLESDNSASLPGLTGWRKHYNAFIGIERATDEIPYSGWLLLYGKSAWNQRLADALRAPKVAEAFFEAGKLKAFIDHTSAIDALRIRLSPKFQMRGFPDYEQELQINESIAQLLQGDYNCTSPGFPAVAKLQNWGISQTTDYECANCRKLQVSNVLPLKRPKRTRKTTYRKNGSSVPQFMPQWVRNIADELDALGTPWDSRHKANTKKKRTS